MRVLALETSTARGSVALVEDGKVIAQESVIGQKSHSENITPFIETCLLNSHLKLTDIDVFATGMGPGSFTGIRIAANAAKTLAFAYNKPLIAIDSLTLLAQQAITEKQPVTAMINAYKNMVYLGVFDPANSEPVVIQGPVAVPVRELKKYVTKKCIVVGDGWNAYHEYFPVELQNLCIRVNGIPDEPLASTLGLMATEQAKAGRTLDWKSFVPLYIRASEAEENKKGILISPLR